MLPVMLIDLHMIARFFFLLLMQIALPVIGILHDSVNVHASSIVSSRLKK
jgi:hypothetical protein